MDVETVSSYTNKQKGDVYHVQTSNKIYPGVEILILDDIHETGDTLEFVKKMYPNQKPLH